MKNHTCKLETWKHAAIPGKMLSPIGRANVCDNSQDSTTAALLLLPSIALMPAEKLSNEKANQNNFEAALYIHRQKAV